jgi:hypothetical protein
MKDKKGNTINVGDLVFCKETLGHQDVTWISVVEKITTEQLSVFLPDNGQEHALVRYKEGSIDAGIFISSDKIQVIHSDLDSFEEGTYFLSTIVGRIFHDFPAVECNVPNRTWSAFAVSIYYDHLLEGTVAEVYPGPDDNGKTFMIYPSQVWFP